MSMIERYRELCTKRQAQAWLRYYEQEGRFPWSPQLTQHPAKF